MGDIVNIFIELCGWIGAALILGAYSLLSLGKIKGPSRAYQAMNIAGAAGLVLNSAWNGAIPSAVLNIIWMGIGFYAVWNAKKTVDSGQP
jgi:hypothetical protein